MPCSPQGLERRTADVVALCVTIDELRDTPDVEIVGKGYPLLRIIRAGAAGVPLTIVAFSVLEVVEVRTVDTVLLVRFALAPD